MALKRLCHVGASWHIASIVCCLLAGTLLLATSPAVGLLQLCAGAYHSCALATGATTTGVVKCWGDNRSGQLGLGKTTLAWDDENGKMGDQLPGLESGNSNWRPQKLSCGFNHTCALSENGDVKCWGLNDDGQLGLEDSRSRGRSLADMGDALRAVAVGSQKFVTSLVAAGAHTCAMLDNKLVKCWGANEWGQLGQGDNFSRGGVVGTMGDALLPVDLGTGRTVVQLGAGAWHTCALLDNARVKCWGWGKAGQLGFTATPSWGTSSSQMGDSLPYVNLGLGRTVLQLHAGGEHTCSLLDNAQVKCWGSNTYQQLGLGHNMDRGGRPEEMGDALLEVDLGPGAVAQQLALGHYHTCALLNSGQVNCWGLGDSGQLGMLASLHFSSNNMMGSALQPVDLGTGRVAVQISAGAQHTCAVLDTQQVKCWGSNELGQLGLKDKAARGLNSDHQRGKSLLAFTEGLSSASSQPPEQLSVQVTAGGAHTCVRTYRVVKCWGKNSAGQLGLEDTSNRGDGSGEMGTSLPPVTLRGGRAAVDVNAGANHTCAVLDNGEVQCWGLNAQGQLGLGNTTGRGGVPGSMGTTTPASRLGDGWKAGSVSAGFAHTCAVANSLVKCWGWNGAAQLGLGDTLDWGSSASRSGNQLPPVALGPGRTVTQVASGLFHSCAVLDSGEVKCWGSNAQGQLGMRDTHTYGNSPNEMGAFLLPVPLGTSRSAVQVAVGFNHTCAMLDNGQVKCWGANQYGQLGLEDTVGRGWTGSDMGNALPAVDLGKGRRALQVTAGGDHSCVLLDTYEVKCWGRNTVGQLGLGHGLNRGDSKGEMGDMLPAVNLGSGRTPVQVSAGSGHTCAVLDNDQVKCWGDNSAGQLGLGDTRPRGLQAAQMGDSLGVVPLGVALAAPPPPSPQRSTSSAYRPPPPPDSSESTVIVVCAAAGAGALLLVLVIIVALKRAYSKRHVVAQLPPRVHKAQPRWPPRQPPAVQAFPVHQNHGNVQMSRALSEWSRRVSWHGGTNRRDAAIPHHHEGADNVPQHHKAYQANVTAEECDVFISYVKSNEEGTPAATALRDTLKTNYGYKVFMFDPSNAQQNGQNVKSIIEAGLKSCKVFVVLATRKYGTPSADSTSYDTCKEYEEATSDIYDPKKDIAFIKLFKGKFPTMTARGLLSNSMWQMWLDDPSFGVPEEVLKIIVDKVLRANAAKQQHLLSEPRTINARMQASQITRWNMRMQQLQ